MHVKHTREYRRIWREVAVTVAGAFNATKPDIAINWADKIADAYVERFDIVMDEEQKREEG